MPGMGSAVPAHPQTCWRVIAIAIIAGSDNPNGCKDLNNSGKLAPPGEIRKTKSSISRIKMYYQQFEIC
jgi:hypothetical protein